MEAVTLATGIALAAYGLAIFRPRSGSSCHVGWLAAGALLGLAGAAALMLPHARALSALATVLGIIAALALGAAAVLGARIMAEARTVPPAGLPCIIVLGAHVHPDGTPSRALRQRLEAARAYLDANPATVAVVSGGQGPDETSTEADAMAAWLIAHGIRPERILREDRSTTTAENLRYTRRLLGGTEPVGIVTNDFHLWRALRIARRAGLAGARGIPAPSTRLYLPNNLVRECLAVCKNLLAKTM